MAPQVGLIARCDDRGLGTMTEDFYHALYPERTLVILNEHDSIFPQHPERFPDGMPMGWGPKGLHEGKVRAWLRGLDVVYTAETTYAPNLLKWARDEGVRVFLHAMPELYHRSLPHCQADEVWNPTEWLHPTLPAGSRVVPVPVSTPPFRNLSSTGPLRVLHVAGRIALGDRNGTSIFLNSLRFTTERMVVRVELQHGTLPRFDVPDNVQLTVNRGRTNRWMLYDDADVLVMPRRYGGLCLPVQEAMACGVAVMMTDCEPNTRTWPVIPISGETTVGTVNTPAGRIATHSPSPRGVARLLDLLATNPDEVATWQARALTWARRNDWETLAPMYRTLLR